MPAQFDLSATRTDTPPPSVLPPRTPAGVSFVIPVHNGEPWLDRVLNAVDAAAFTGPVEVIVVDDGSTDGSRVILEQRARSGRVRVIDGPGRGAAAAMNAGIRAAVYPFIAQIDQDVVIGPHWLDELMAALEDESVGAAQGHYVAAPGAGLWSRVMALDLSLRYRSLGRWTNHVCTGNSVYRTRALIEAGLFDETLGYGYDNDISYRLAGAGYRLAFRREAVSAHHWREGAAGYIRQQYGFGYGRLDLVAKHRDRVSGDDVSRILMMLHGPVMAAALAALAAAALCRIIGWPATVPAMTAGVLIGALLIDRMVDGVRAATVQGDPIGLLFPIAHLVRDVAWAAAIVVWTLRRVRGAAPKPADSMPPTRATDA
jgi:cellulose synthase/poly-beta-1,6-N-acetylglucosamine synthase-like glycosyltransferase